MQIIRYFIRCFLKVLYLRQFRIQFGRGQGLGLVSAPETVTLPEKSVRPLGELEEMTHRNLILRRETDASILRILWSR